MRPAAGCCPECFEGPAGHRLAQNVIQTGNWDSCVGKVYSEWKDYWLVCYWGQWLWPR
jgi:hypothetical protein